MSGKDERIRAAARRYADSGTTRNAEALLEAQDDVRYVLTEKGRAALQALELERAAAREEPST